MAKINKQELHNIFAGIQNHNELEFNKLYEKYKNLVYGVAFSILKNKEDSEEVVQNIFLKIFKLDKEKLPNGNEASWLYTFSKNESINFLRTRRENIDIENIYYISDNEDRISDLIDMDSYNKIIVSLNEKEKEIVSLRILSNLTFKEISQMLSIPLGTVQWRYYNAMHTLRLVISNLSMFILTIVVFVAQKSRKKKQLNEEVEIPDVDISGSEEARKDAENTINETENKGLEGVITKDDSEKKKDNEVSNTQDNIVEIDKTENMTIETDTKIENLNKTDIGILCVSGIFLIITIIFLIKFVKTKQKAKKKVSK